MSSPPLTRIYLDHNATSPRAPGVVEAVASALELPGNPSSPHAEGRAASALLDRSRQTIADALQVEPLDLIFCSGGTEANHLALLGLARTLPRGATVWLPRVVHPSLWAAGEALSAQGMALRELPVDSAGRVPVHALEKELTGHGPGIAGVSWVNHELGTVEDVEALARASRAAGCLLHIDAVQALGKIPIDLASFGADSVSISAHKIGGPKGIGALWVKPGPNLGPLVGGGKQESGRRPGTQGLPAIAGFAAAMIHVDERLSQAARLSELRDQLRDGLTTLGAELMSPAEGTCCNTVCARLPGLAGDMLVSGLDLKGIAISTGAACSSGMALPSPVLLGIGKQAGEALEAIRISLGPENVRTDVEAFLELLPSIIERARRFS